MEEESTIISYSNQNEGKESKSTKELLTNLLQKMLDHKLNKLEKKHVEESNKLKEISKISQNIIISLEYYSHKVRKEIYKIRHKNDENNKKKEHQKIINDINNKSLLKEDKSDNNIESLIENKSILESNLNDVSYINKIMNRASKSIDSKKVKELILTSELDKKYKLEKESLLYNEKHRQKNNDLVHNYQKRIKKFIIDVRIEIII